MAAGDVKSAYAASSNLTVTSLDSLASSATQVAGWESALIDNSTDKYLDYSVEVKVTVAAAGLAVGVVTLWLVKMLDDSTWPDVFDGTQSAETVTDTEIRDAICRPAALTATDTTASRVYYLSCPSVAAVFGGNQPEKFLAFITQTTTAALAASGNQVTVKGSYNTVAQ